MPGIGPGRKLQPSRPDLGIHCAELLALSAGSAFGTAASSLLSPSCRANSSAMKKYAAEALGTFALVFAGTGAIVINEASSGAITHAGIALTFGLVVLAMVYTVGDISGAHLNPAVTLGFWTAKRLPGCEVSPF